MRNKCRCGKDVDGESRPAYPRERKRPPPEQWLAREALGQGVRISDAMNSQLLLWQKIVAVMVGLLGGATLGVFGFIVGVILGGNMAVGYEAGGVFGALLGVVLGVALCSAKAVRIFAERNYGRART